MKITTAYAFIWISCAIAISTAVIVTHRLSPLWALLIPAMISFKSSDN
jgi:hypothetical protein